MKPRKCTICAESFFTELAVNTEHMSGEITHADHPTLDIAIQREEESELNGPGVGGCPHETD